MTTFLTIAGIAIIGICGFIVACAAKSSEADRRAAIVERQKRALDEALEARRARRPVRQASARTREASKRIASLQRDPMRGQA